MVTRDPDPPKLRVTHLRRPTNEGKGSDLHAVGDNLRPWPERGICSLQRIVIPEEITVTVDGGRLRGPDKRYTHQCMQVPS